MTQYNGMTGHWRDMSGLLSGEETQVGDRFWQHLNDLDARAEVSRERPDDVYDEYTAEPVNTTNDEALEALSFSFTEAVDDPRDTTAECLCLNGLHTAYIREVNDPRDPISRLDVHVPFALVQFGTPPQQMPYDPMSRLTNVGRRLAYRLYGLDTVEAFNFSRHHLSFYLATAIGRQPVQSVAEQALRESGCPDLTFDDTTDGISRSRNRLGFQ